MDKLRVGVVGVGHLGQHHARIYSTLPGVELVGVVDADAEQARRVADKLGCKVVAGAEALAGQVDAVSVATPTVAHLKVARLFLERGAAALVEKPLAPNVAEAQEMVDLARSRGATLQVGHIERFNPAVRAALDLGVKPVFIESHRMSPFRFRSVDVGVVFDLMIHDIDLVLRFVGAEVESVDAAGAPVISPSEDIASARLSFANGCVANLTASRVSMKSMRKTRLFSRDRYVSIDSEAKETVVCRKSPRFEETAARLRQRDAGALAELKALAFGDLVNVEKLKLPDVEPLKAELESFVAAAREKRAPEVTGEDGLRAVRTAAQIVELIQGRLRRAGW